MPWKIFATIIITLVIVAIMLSANPQVAGFFSGIFGGFSNVVQEEDQRSLNFTLTVDRYDKITYDSSRNVNITMNVADFDSKIGDLQINATGKDVYIINYKGKIEVISRILKLNGRFENFLLPGVASITTKTISAEPKFNTLVLENFGPKKIEINATGNLETLQNQNIFSGIIIIEEPLGTFNFGEKLVITGKAKKIMIPQSGISIG